jgi:protein-disulfide isomerase
MPLYVILGVVALGGAIFVGREMLAKGEGAREPVQVTLNPSQLNAVQGISRGSPDAPVTMFEFADFQCPHCAQFATLVEPELHQKLVDSGVVRVVFYDFPLPQFPYGFAAARAGRCANEQGKFWEWHDAAFRSQQQWSYAKSLSAAVDHWTDYAEQVGMDAGNFEACVRSDKYQKEVSESKRLGESLGITGTPGIIINGKRLSDIPANFDELNTIVQAERGTPAPAAAAPAAPAADSAAPQADSARP